MLDLEIPGDGRTKAGARPAGGFRRIAVAQVFGSPVWLPSRELLRFLANVGLEDEDRRQVVRLGVLARGHEALDDVEVRFSIRRLKGRRTFVFARAGYGKSNLVKLLLSRLYSAPPDVGLLIVDPEGEYAFRQRSEADTPIPGFVDHPELRDRVRIFTDREPLQFNPDERERIGGRIRLNVARLTPGEFLAAFVPPEKQEQVWANWLRAAGPSRWSVLVDLLRERGYRASDEEIRAALGHPSGHSGKPKEADPSLQAIRNNVLPVLHRVDTPDGDPLEEIRVHLLGLGRPPGVVILDVSAVPGRDADAVVRTVLRRIFRDRVEAFTQGPGGSRGVLLVLEEAQSVLGGQSLDDQDIYVRWVKEGRKYGLGALLVTQQPGAISPLLLSQGDNFFAMHLLSERDLSALGAANAHFSPEILDFLRREPVKGNCYFWAAPDQPYVVPVRVDSYERTAGAGAGAGPPGRQGAPVPNAGAVGASGDAFDYDVWLRGAILRALGTDPQVYLYRVDSLDGEPVSGCLAAAASYLASRLPGAERLQEVRPDDWESCWNRVALRASTLDRALEAAGLAWRPARAVGTVEGREDRPMVLLREERLDALARQEGLKVKRLRSQPLELRTRFPM